MTHDELKTITEHTQEEIIQPPEKTKRESMVWVQIPSREEQKFDSSKI
jgi:hypothetical protein